MGAFFIGFRVAEYIYLAFSRVVPKLLFEIFELLFLRIL